MTCQWEMSYIHSVYCRKCNNMWWFIPKGMCYGVPMGDGVPSPGRSGVPSPESLVCPPHEVWWRVWCDSPGGEGLVRPLQEGRVWCAGADLERFDRVRTNSPWILYSNLHFVGTMEHRRSAEVADLATNNATD